MTLKFEIKCEFDHSLSKESINEMLNMIKSRIEGYSCDYTDELKGGNMEIRYINPEKYSIPYEAHSIEVFAIKDSKDSPTGKQAYIGYKLANGDFHFIQVPYTEKINSEIKNEESK